MPGFRTYRHDCIPTCRFLGQEVTVHPLQVDHATGVIIWGVPTCISTGIDLRLLVREVGEV